MIVLPVIYHYHTGEYAGRNRSGVVTLTPSPSPAPLPSRVTPKRKYINLFDKIDIYACNTAITIIVVYIIVSFIYALAKSLINNKIQRRTGILQEISALVNCFSETIQNIIVFCYM